MAMSASNPVFLKYARQKTRLAIQDNAHFQTINQVQVLDVPGDVTKGEILR
jgi:hypothetical protein